MQSHRMQINVCFVSFYCVIVVVATTILQINITDKVDSLTNENRFLFSVSFHVLLLNFFTADLCMALALASTST